MKGTARVLASFLAMFLAMLLVVPACLAQTFPSKPVRIVIPFPPGGPSDLLVRLLAQKLSERWSQPVIPENRPGANAIIGTEAVIKSPADGHTLLITTDSTVTSNPSIYSKLPYDPMRDLAPITLMAWSRLAIVVNADSGPKSLPELVQSARANPGKVNFGAGSITARLTGELFKRQLGLDMVFIPYTGARSVEGLLSGDVTFLVVAGSTVLPFIQKGRFRAIAVTGAQPMRSLPGVPTVAEAANLPGFDSSVWLGLFAPAGTPPAVIQRLYQDFTQAILQPDIRQRLEAIGLDPETKAPSEFAAFIRKETEIWSRIVRQAGIQGD